MTHTLCRLTPVLRRGGVSASSMEQNGDAAVASGTLVGCSGPHWSTRRATPNTKGPKLSSSPNKGNKRHLSWRIQAIAADRIPNIMDAVQSP
jgi:hypothetical protein